MLFLTCVFWIKGAAMKANPGGILDPREVVGRDALIDDLWDKLQRHGVTMTAERRMGKTSILNKMRVKPPPGITAFYWSLEKVRSPEELVREIFNNVSKELGDNQKWQGRIQQFWKDWGLGGGTIVGVTLPKPELSWKQHLEGIVRDLATQVEGADLELWLFLFDELPLAIDNIRQEKGVTAAMEVLDTLRWIRQNYPQIRMVYTGSVGLHHVVAELKTQGYRNAPTNDLPPFDVGPISVRDAEQLAQDLLVGEEIVVDDLTAVSKAIAAAVDAMPFYIHYVVDSLKGKMVTVAQVETTIQASLCQYKAWDMDHYEERIKSYYGDKAKLALLALDELAAEAALSVADWRNRISLQTPDLDKEVLRSTLNLLEQDHYIERNTEGNYQFRFSIVQRYWQQQRLG
jgi:hypothetical protein